MMRKPKRVPISGDGIAGFTLAYWLCRAGIVPIVVERSNGVRSERYVLDFFGSGFDVAERMKIIPALEAERVPVERFVTEGEQA